MSCMKLPASRRFSSGCNGTAACCCTSKMSLFLYSAHEWCFCSACFHRFFIVTNPSPHSWQMNGVCIVGGVCSVAPAHPLDTFTKCGTCGDSIASAGVYVGFC